MRVFTPTVDQETLKLFLADHLKLLQPSQFGNDCYIRLLLIQIPLVHVK